MLDKRNVARGGIKKERSDMYVGTVLVEGLATIKSCKSATDGYRFSKVDSNSGGVKRVGSSVVVAMCCFKDTILPFCLSAL
jgi:hypothetical protein